MGNYFNELRWKIIRDINRLQFIHQVTIEIRFLKSLAQERFKSNLEFRNQIIVSSIKFWKCFAKFMKSNSYTPVGLTTAKASGPNHLIYR